MIYCCIDSFYLLLQTTTAPPPSLPKFSDFLKDCGGGDWTWEDDPTLPNYYNWGSLAPPRFKVKLQYPYPPPSSPPADCYSKHMLLEHMSSNISAIKHISNSHFERTEHFMTNTLQILEKMVDNIDNVLNKVLTLENDHHKNRPSDDE